MCKRIGKQVTVAKPNPDVEKSKCRSNSYPYPYLKSFGICVYEIQIPIALFSFCWVRPIPVESFILMFPRYPYKQKEYETIVETTSSNV